ncbi:hypothetical protein D3C86_1620980 [compost metagenome]
MRSQIARLRLRQAQVELQKCRVVEQADRLARQHQRAVVARAADQRMELDVELDQVRVFFERGGAAALQHLCQADVLLERLDVGGLDRSRRQARRQRLEGHCDFPELMEGRLLQQQQPCGAWRHVVEAGQDDIEPATFAALQQAFLLDLTDRFSHGGAVHTKAFGQHLLRGQRHARLDVTGQDAALDLGGHRLVGGLEMQALEHRRFTRQRGDGGL